MKKPAKKAVSVGKLKKEFMKQDKKDDAKLMKKLENKQRKAK